MKSAFRAVGTAIYFLLCLLALSSTARAAIEPPQIVPEPPPETIMPAKPAIISTLEAAVFGLQMPSETDAPFQVVFFELNDEKAPATKPDANNLAPKEPATRETVAVASKLTTAQIAVLVEAPGDAEIETRDLDEFFDAAATPEKWMNADERATAARFAALLKLLKTELKDVQVVVWGDAEKRVAIIGKCEGGAAGLTTIVVET